MKKKVFIILLLLVIVIGCSAISFQNDTFYSIKIGEDVFKYGIDFLDHHSFHNLGYMYPHFLFDIVVYIFYNWFGFMGLYVLTIMFGLVLAIVIYNVIYRLSSNFIHSLLFTFIGILFMKSFLCLRAQIVSLSIFALEYYLLYKLCNNSKDNKKNMFLLFVLGVILVNIHTATYPFYLIVIGAFWVSSKKKSLFISFILCLLCGFISIMGVDAYTYLINTLLNSTTLYIEEHQPLVLIKNIPFLLLFCIVIWFLFTKWEEIKSFDKLLLIGTMFMTLTSVRHGMFLLLYSLIIIGSYMGRYSLNKERDIVIKLEKRVLSNKGMVICIGVVMVFSFVSFNSMTSREFVSSKEYPIDIVNYIKDNMNYNDIRIFNDINIGSYLMFNDIPVFIDSRTDLYTYTYNKKRDIFNDYIGVMMMGIYYEDVFDNYNIGYVLIQRGCGLDVYLNKDSNYSVIRNDDNFVLWKRNV